jgi:hypothetical protein
MNIRALDSLDPGQWISLLNREMNQVISEGMWSKEEYDRLRYEIGSYATRGDSTSTLRMYAGVCGFVIGRAGLEPPVWTEEIALSVRELYEEMNHLIADSRWTQAEYERLRVRISAIAPRHFEVVDTPLTDAAIRTGLKLHANHVPKMFKPTDNDVRVGKELYVEAERLVREGQWNRANYRRILMLMHELTYFMTESERELIRLGLRTRVIGPGT